MTVDEFINDYVLLLDTVDLSLSESQKTRFVNRGASNIRSDIRRLESETMTGYSSAAIGTTNEADLPNDRDRECPILFYLDATYDRDSIISTDLFRIKGNKVKITGATGTVYFEYIKTLTRYTDVTDVIEFQSTAVLEKLASEVQALIYAAQDQNQSTASYQNSLEQSNRI